MNANLTDKQIQHLYWRLGFGISNAELKKVRRFSKEKIVARIFKKSTTVKKIAVDLSVYNKLKQNNQAISREERRKQRQLATDLLRELNKQWCDQLYTTEAILREKMTLFFMNHFSVRVNDPAMNQYFNNMIRENSLENFGTLLTLVSKSPIMLKFLNNKQNKKQKPNENFAREVMELFTLGRDNGYTEIDIKEAARAFTGWNYNGNGFLFKEKHHDKKQKTFLGKTGKFDGDAILKILLEQKQTARYITQKIYKYLVNEKIDEQRVEQLTTVFYDSKYNISALLQSIFMSDWFYEKENIGVLIKSPIELVTGLRRQFDVKFNNSKALIFIQRQLNQSLFYPPNVAGWPGGKYWIDNSTLMIRLKLPSVLLNRGIIEFNEEAMMENAPMEEQEAMMQMGRQSMGKKKNGNDLTKRIKVEVDWSVFLASINGEDRGNLSEFLIQPKLSPPAQKVVNAAKNSNIKDYTIQLLSLPEYQLC